MFLAMLTSLGWMPLSIHLPLATFFFFSLLRQCNLNCPETNSVGQAGLELTELCLPLLPECQDERHKLAPPPTFFFFNSNTISSAEETGRDKVCSCHSLCVSTRVSDRAESQLSLENVSLCLYLIRGLCGEHGK